MASKIISCGTKHGTPKDGLVIEVKDFANPWSVPQLRHLTGKDDLVQQYITDRTKDFKVKVTGLALIAHGIQGPVYLACTGGKHRSVYLAELLSQRLQCPVEHRDL